MVQQNYEYVPAYPYHLYDDTRETRGKKADICRLIFESFPTFREYTSLNPWLLLVRWYYSRIESWVNDLPDHSSLFSQADDVINREFNIIPII